MTETDAPKTARTDETTQAEKSVRMAAPTRFEPFAEDATVQTVGGLSIENGTHAIAIHGAVDLTRDAAGLARARALATTLSAIVTALEARPLPEGAGEATRASAPVKNPFA